MRFPAVVFPVVLALAGAGYFLAKPKEDLALASLAEQLERLDQVPGPQTDDERDAAQIRKALDSRDLSAAEANALIEAAARRYVRRKLAYADASASGKSDKAALEGLHKDMERARRLYDLAESIARRNRYLAGMARADYELERRLAYAPSTLIALVDRFHGNGAFTESDMAALEKAFYAQFGKPLPVSARGASSVHRALGLDHRGRFDVAVAPEHAEGLWVRRYLTARNVSFFAFRSAAAGQATGAHIHIGPASRRGASD